MALRPVMPNTHPTRLVQYMDAFRGEVHRTKQAIKEETDPEKGLVLLEDLAEQVESLTSVVASLALHVSRAK